MVFACDRSIGTNTRTQLWLKPKPTLTEKWLLQKSDGESPRISIGGLRRETFGERSVESRSVERWNRASRTDSGI